MGRWIRWGGGGLFALLGSTVLIASVSYYPPLQEARCVATFAVVLGFGTAVSLDRYLRGCYASVPDNGKRVAERLHNVTEDRRFREVAGLDRPGYALYSRIFQVIFQAALPGQAIRYSSVFQGGFAGEDQQGYLVLALSPWHLRTAPAAHELFHLVRHVYGRARLDQEPTWWVSIREESIVWYQTVRYAGFRGILELFFAAAPVTIPVTLLLYLCSRVCYSF